MAAYRKINRFVPFASNTTCDFTGFVKKSTEVIRQWDGLYGIPEAVSIRQPQDFAPNILPTMTFPNTRYEYPIVEGNYQIPYTIVYDENGAAYQVTNRIVDSDGAVYSVDEYVTDSNGVRWRIFKSDLEWNVV
jgi:hypothetical protein